LVFSSASNTREDSAQLLGSGLPLPTFNDRYLARGTLPRTVLSGSTGRLVWAVGMICAVLLSCAAGYFAGRRRDRPLARIERLTHSGHVAPGAQATESFPALVTDGLRIFTPVIADGRTAMAQIDVHSGAIQPMHVPSEIPSPTLGDLSLDGTNLLLRSHLSPESEQPLWIVPTSGGSALRLSNVVAHDATWMLDGTAVLYAAGNQLVVYKMQDQTSSVFATLPGRAFWMRWSPDGTLLRFTLMDPVDHTLSLWQIDSHGNHAKPLLPGGSAATSMCCGTWAGDGRSFIYQVSQGSNTDLWRLQGKDTDDPQRITNGPLSFVAPATARNGQRLYFLGLETESALLQLDPVAHRFIPEAPFLAAANRVEYSRDRNWVLWTDAQGRLWRARADGSELVQVTPDSLQVFLARWSPDGTQIALMAREQGKAWQLFMVAPDGGTPVPLLSENRNAADPSWSADGQKIVFGRITDLMGKEDGPRALELVDLKTHEVSMVPGSNGLFSPRWSPDGRYIAAITLDQKRLMLLDTTTQTWRTLATTSVADPVWAADSKSLSFHASQAEMQPIYRASIPDGHLEQVANLASFSGGNTADYFFCGLTPNDEPIVRSRTSTGDIYSLDLNEQ
jgi:Tol biopolymer transport system component